LAEANEEEVLKLWQGLILLSCYLHKTAHVAWELAGVFQIITVIYWSWKEWVYRSRDCFVFLQWSGSCCGRECVWSRYFDVETDIAWLLPKGVCSTGFRIDAKRQSCYFNHGVRCFAMHLKSKLWCCLTIVALQKKKVDQPVKSRSWRCAIVTLIIWLFLTRMKTP
jgi:hypothetical protein